jgi:hypothetical protein
MAMGEDGNATVWIFSMKNMFGWRDKQDIDHTSGGSKIKSFADMYSVQPKNEDGEP